MRILNWYVTRDFLVAFGMAIAILTFAMMGARLVEVFELVSKGVPLENFFWFTVYTLPIVLTYTIPWSILVATILVFGRMSADSEVTAMRACGVSILQIISPLLLITVMMTACCLYLQVNIGPPMLDRARTLMKNAAITQPLALFEPGKPVVYEGSLIYIDDKISDHEIQGVQIFTFDDKGVLKQDIIATHARLELNEAEKIMTVRLFDCMIVDKVPNGDEQRIFNEELHFSIDYGRKLNQANVSIKPKYMTFEQLLAHIKYVKENKGKKVDICELEVLLNGRIAMALSPIAFLLLGLPLAIRTSRRETSVGIFLSVILGGAFFLAVIICESITKLYFIYPQYLIWLPNLIYQVCGAFLIYRVSKR